jgi:hypothetical protein
VPLPALGCERPSNPVNDITSRVAIEEADIDLVGCPAAPRSWNFRTAPDPRSLRRLDSYVRCVQGHRISNPRHPVENLTTVSNGVIKAKCDPRCEDDRHSNKRE